MPTNDFLPFATAGGANVLSQSDWNALAARLSGYTAGVAQSQQVNKGLRQAAAMAAMIGQLINDYGGLDALDDGNISNLETALARTLQAGKFKYAVATGTANAWVVAPTPALAAYAAGQVLWVKAPATNTSTTVTVNISGLGTRSLKKNDGTDPQVADLVSGTWYPTINDGTNVCVVSALPSQARAAAFKLSRTVYSSTGAFSFTVPAGVTQIRVKAWGGGAGGSFGTNPSGPAGGGGGAYFEISASVTPGASVTGSVGAGGSAGANAVAAGAGGDTTVTISGTTYTAGGGAAGLNTNANSVSNSAIGGSVSGAVDVSRSGEPSQGGLQGYSGSGTLYYAGKGGGAPNGGYGGNGGTGAGNPGQVPGGGGAGGANGGTAGAGARGEVWIEY